jgi:hypothetical protein
LCGAPKLVSGALFNLREKCIAVFAGIDLIFDFTAAFPNSLIVTVSFKKSHFYLEGGDSSPLCLCPELIPGDESDNELSHSKILRRVANDVSLCPHFYANMR